MTDNILNNSLVDMVLAHNVGGPTGFDAISNDQLTNFEKHATGFTGMLYNMVSQDMTESFKLNFQCGGRFYCSIFFCIICCLLGLRRHEFICSRGY